MAFAPASKIDFAVPASHALLQQQRRAFDVELGKSGGLFDLVHFTIRLLRQRAISRSGRDCINSASGIHAASGIRRVANCLQSAPSCVSSQRFRLMPPPYPVDFHQRR